MRGLSLVVAVALAAACLGCGKSGTKPAGQTTGAGSTDSAVSPAGGKLTPAELGRQSLAGANPAPLKDETPEDGGALIDRYGAEPDTLNPLTATDAYSSRIMEYVTDSLAQRNLDTLELEPALAASWELSDDHLNYTFHLRKDVKWHDGKPFTSADVVYSHGKMMDPNVNAPHLRNYYIDLESVTAPDEWTVVFRWKKPYWLSFEFSAGIPILPRHVFDTKDEFNTHPAGRRPVGNGMFRFVSWKTGDEIVLERNEDYYGRKPHIKSLVIRFVPDDNSALQQAASGTIDSMRLSTQQWVNELAKDVYRNNFNRFYVYGNGYSYIGWNLRKPFFSDKRVRRAMTHLVNRQEILDNILYGLGKIVTGTFCIFSKSYSPEIKPWPYDPAEAKRLLDEAGWSDHDGDGIRDKVIDGAPTKFSFTFMHPSAVPTSRRIAELLQEELRKVGIEMNIQTLEWATFLQKTQAGDFDAVTLGWTSDTVDDDPYQIWHSSQVKEGSNYIAFANPEADALMEKARTEFDPDTRNAMYHRLNEILHDEQPYTFLFTGPALAIVNKRVHNVIVHKMRMDVRDYFVPKNLQAR